MRALVLTLAIATLLPATAVAGRPTSRADLTRVARAAARKLRLSASARYRLADEAPASIGLARPGGAARANPDDPFAIERFYVRDERVPVAAAALHRVAWREDHAPVPIHILTSDGDIEPGWAAVDIREDSVLIQPNHIAVNTLWTRAQIVDRIRWLESKQALEGVEGDPVARLSDGDSNTRALLSMLRDRYNKPYRRPHEQLIPPEPTPSVEQQASRRRALVAERQVMAVSLSTLRRLRRAIDERAVHETSFAP